MIVSVTKENFEEEVLKSKVPAILDFYADWCGPCQAQRRIFEELDGKYNGKIKFCKCNAEENEDLADDFQVQTIPTLVFFENGVKTHQLSTVLQEPSIRRLLNLE